MRIDQMVEQCIGRGAGPVNRLHQANQGACQQPEGGDGYRGSRGKQQRRWDGGTGLAACQLVLYPDRTASRLLQREAPVGHHLRAL